MIAVLAVLAALLTAAPARADRESLEVQIGLSALIASRYWPHACHPRIDWLPHLAPRVAAQAPMSPPPEDCRIEFSEPVMRGLERDGLNFAGVCAMVVHEVGHLAGRPHSTDPRSVMRADGAWVPWACWHPGPWLARHP